MANSVDPDQTAPSGSALFAYVILSDTLVFKFLGYLPYIFFLISRRKYWYSLEAPHQCTSNENPTTYVFFANEKNVNLGWMRGFSSSSSN